MKKYSILLLLALIIAAPAFGVTRFYLPSSGAAAVSPAYTAGWNDTTVATRLRCTPNKISSGLGTITTPNVLTAEVCLCHQYVSDPIAAQLISGNVSGEIQGAVSSASQFTASSEITIKVVSGDGTTVRGTLLTLTKGSVAYTTTATARWTPIPSTSVSSVTSVNGDRIVIEVGVLRGSANNARTTSMNFRDDGTTDLTEGVTTATNNPWVEFSATIKFVSSEVVID